MDVSPSARWYRVAWGLIALGVLGAASWAVYALSNQTDQVNEHVRLPSVAGTTVAIDEPGTYTVWAGSACGGYCPPESPVDYREHLTIGFVGPDGPLTLEPFPGDARYNIGTGRQGRAVWLLRVDEPGEYAFERASDGEMRSPPLLLGRGEGLPANVFPGVWLILAGGVGAGALLATVVWRRRAAAFDARAAAAFGRRPTDQPASSER